jgi:hypothetical protein
MTPRVATAPAATADELRRSLDRAVTITRTGRLLAAAGSWLATAAVIVAALAAIDVASGGRVGIAFLPPAAKLALILTAAFIPAIALWRRRIAGEGWPTRLAVALATEAARPSLGESVSRAVEFLGPTPARPRRRPRGHRPIDRPGPSPDETTAEFERLAIDEAAAAARAAGGPVVPGLVADAAGALAGIATALAVWCSTMIAGPGWEDALRRQCSTPRTPPRAAGTADHAAARTAPPTTASLPPEAVAAAAQLAAAASVERRLADVLAADFARSPGASAESLPRADRHRLEELAAIQTTCLRSIAAGGRAIRVAAGSSPCERLASAIERLESLDSLVTEASPAAISANRLHAAGTAAAALADALTAIAAGLGAAGDDQPGAELLPPHRSQQDGVELSPGPLTAAATTVERIAGETDRVAAVGSSRPSPPSRGGDGAGPAAAATATPDGGPVAAAARAAPPADASPVERVWSRLPATDRWQTGRTAAESTPPAYRAAVDTYYRLLLQSLPDRPSPAPP